jgi:ribosome recycling factor
MNDDVNFYRISRLGRWSEKNDTCELSVPIYNKHDVRTIEKVLQNANLLLPPVLLLLLLPPFYDDEETRKR